MSGKHLRPPGALAERDFLATCIRCGKCAQSCPFGAIRLAGLLEGIENMGTPVIRPRTVPCYLCMKCPPVCPSGALRRSVTKREDVRMGTAMIDKKTCLAWQGTLCRSCFDECPFFDVAIKLDDKLQPVVEKEKCAGCGICESVCPADPAAIVVKRGDRT